MDDNQHESERPHPFIKLKNEEGTEDVHYSLFYDSVPSEFEAVALKELNETEENKRKGMLQLKDLMKKDGVTDVDDSVLLAVLRKCKFNFKKSEEQLKKYVSLHKFILDRLQEVDMKRLENVLDHRAFGLLPYRDKHGRAFIVTTPNVDFDLFDFEDVALCGLCCTLYALTFPLTSITGLAYIGEYKAQSLYILYRMMMSFRRYTLPTLNLPFRLARMDAMNESFIVRWSLKIMRPLLPSKFVQRIHFCGSDIKSLHKVYNPDLLPEEFGGTTGPMNPNLYKRELFNFIERLKSRSLMTNNANCVDDH